MPGGDCRGFYRTGGAVSIRTIQDDLVTEDLAQYKGSWIAIRDGKVVAAAPNPDQLFEDQNVRDDDEISLVPVNPGMALFL